MSEGVVRVEVIVALYDRWTHLQCVAAERWITSFVTPRLLFDAVENENTEIPTGCVGMLNVAQISRQRCMFTKYEVLCSALVIDHTLFSVLLLFVLDNCIQL